MIKNNKQTVRQYATISKIPLRQVLADLKEAGFPSSADDVVNAEMRKELSRCFRKRSPSGQREAEVKAKANEIKRLLKRQKESEETQAKAEKLMRELEIEAQAKAKALKRELEIEAQDQAEKLEWQKDKIGLKPLRANAEIKVKKVCRLIDLCFDLIPATIGEKIKVDCQNELLKAISSLPEQEGLCNKLLSNIYYDTVSRKVDKKSDLYLARKACERSHITLTNAHVEAKNAENTSLYKKKKEIWDKAIKNYFLKLDAANAIEKKLETFSFIIPAWAINDHSINFEDDYKTCLVKFVRERKKQHCYTDAIVGILYFLLNHFDINDWDWPDFKNFSFIGELFMDMGAIDSALKLYAIDERVFNNSNALGALVAHAIKVNNLEQSNKLLEKLIEREPYHFSIPGLRAEIKRIEQRHCLKSAFSIDFAKIDELSGVEFEHLLMDKFIAMGFKVEPTPKTSDFGADLIVENSEGTRIIVQCKRFKSKVNLKAVQEVVGAIGHYVGDMGVVITNNSFLNSAVKLAESHDIELWDGDKLVSFLAGDLSFSEVLGGK